jgi:hypothetical protein
MADRKCKHCQRALPPFTRAHVERELRAVLGHELVAEPLAYGDFNKLRDQLLTQHGFLSATLQGLLRDAQNVCVLCRQVSS